ncbi:MAG: T9SS type A sorting domain-containing protein [Bacteroidales bacterium]|nr:T9SS type A sorting domain-containing protein [Bacteroidales bacterium]MDD4217421.1 T9SS type A sorting domain-containing protein [Bacteroidales bacterium]MDY0141700.1 T9SS type A sorting domain-containing protein [Bacteroidales bacterium]
MKYCKILLIILFVCFLNHNVFSQDLSWIMYDHTNSPLPAGGTEGGYLAGMVEDQYGNKWIASSNGLFKWNGDVWTHYNSENSGLPHDVMHCIAIDKNDVMWIGTGYGGLTRFDGINWFSYDYSNSNIPYTEIISISINNSNNEIWMCLYGCGIAKFDGNSFTHYITPDSPWEEDLNYEIGIENDTTVWVTTIGVGLARLSGNEWTIFDSTNSELSATSSLYIAIDYNNNKYVTTNNGLFIIDQYGVQTMLDTGYFVSSQSKAIWGIIATSDSSIWIAGHNLINLKNGEWQNFSLAEIQPYGMLYHLYEDRNGNLWAWILNKLYYLEINSNIPNFDSYVQVSACPNPFLDIIKFNSIGNENIESISLFDMSGRLVHFQNNTQGGSNIEMNGSFLSQGCYIAYLQTNGSKVKKYIKIFKN